jgi:Asp/Glu/hydantoin racemase
VNRILLINPNTSPAVTDLVAAHVRQIAGERATVVPVTGRFGARYISTRAGAAIAGHAALDALAEHFASGDIPCDVVYLACFGDPALAALKEVSPVPVIGMAEASCREACCRGARFAIVTGGALWQPMLREFVHGLGLSERLATIRTIAPTGDEIARDPDAALDELVVACKACAAEDGANVVIVGGAALAGACARIAPVVPIPLICSVEAGALAAIAAGNGERCQSSVPAVKSTGLSPALAKLLDSDGCSGS